MNINWFVVFALIVGTVAGYLIGATRAHMANAKYMDRFNHWLRQHADIAPTRTPEGSRPPLDESYSTQSHRSPERR